MRDDLSGIDPRNEASPAPSPRHQLAEQAVRRDLCNRHCVNLTDEGRWRHDLNRLQIWGAADDLARMAAEFFEQDIELTTDKFRIESSLVAADPVLEDRQPLGFDGFRYLVGHCGGWSAWAG